MNGWVLLHVVLQWAALLSVFIYVPFAKTWQRGVFWAFLVSLIALLSALWAIHLDPTCGIEPLGGGFIMPVIVPMIGLVVRSLKKAIFYVTGLFRIEEKLRERCSRVTPSQPSSDGTGQGQQGPVSARGFAEAEQGQAGSVKK